MFPMAELENPYKLQIDSWELKPQAITADSSLSEGVFGKVYKGHVIGPINNNNLPNYIKRSAIIPVAIKILQGILYFNALLCDILVQDHLVLAINATSCRR